MFKEGYKYFAQNLQNPYKRDFYQKVYEAIKIRQPTITFDYHEITPSQAKEIVKLVFEDNPSFFYLDPYQTSAVAGNPSVLTFYYVYDTNTSKNYENQIKKIIMNFFDQYKILELPIYHRILIFHNFISSICIYDSVVASGKEGVHEDYNIIGVFNGKVAVCYGFSQVFKLLCDYGNVNCLIVRGATRGEENHAWNMVEYEGGFYHVDVTWDLSKGKNAGLLGSYRYFMVDDDWIRITRNIGESAPYPSSKGLMYTYYGFKNYMISSIDELSDYIYCRLKEYPKEIVVVILNRHFTQDMVHQAYLEAYDHFVKTENVQLKNSVRISIDDERYGIVRILIE